MKGFREAIETALGDFIERHTGVKAAFKPSKAAHLATSAFYSSDAEGIAARLSANASDCTLLNAPLLSNVRAENGWLLFFFTADAIDAYAGTLPPAEEPDDSFFARRLWIAYRHEDAQTPDDPSLLDGFFAVLFGAPNAEQRWLSAPRRHDGNARAALEQRLSRMAKILLWERRKTP